MEEIINRLFEELAKQTIRAGEAEKEREQYKNYWLFYKERCEALEKQIVKEDADA